MQYRSHLQHQRFIAIFSPLFVTLGSWGASTCWYQRALEVDTVTLVPVRPLPVAWWHIVLKSARWWPSKQSRRLRPPSMDCWRWLPKSICRHRGVECACNDPQYTLRDLVTEHKLVTAQGTGVNRRKSTDRVTYPAAKRALTWQIQP
jgi:hypothetical protein